MKRSAIGLTAVISTIFKELEWLPPFWPFLALFAAMSVDFATGILKARIRGEVRNSSGYRRTAAKFTQYGGGIFLSAFLTVCSMLSDKPWFKLVASFMGDGFVWFLVFTECTSILENLYEVDPTSKVSVYVYQPLLKVCTFQFRNNPLFQAARQITEEQGTEPQAVTPTNPT